MPRLPSEAAKKAKEAAAAGGFTPLKAGTCEARLTKCEATTAKSSGNPMWKWEFEIVEDPYVGRRQWVNTVLVENAMWKLGEVFEAFGVPTDTDTEELIGEHVLLEVSEQPISGGARAGQPGNNVDRVLPLDADAAAAVAEERGEPVGAGGSAAAGW
jgi:hypothetical protein